MKKGVIQQVIDQYGGLDVNLKYRQVRFKIQFSKDEILSFECGECNSQDLKSTKDLRTMPAHFQDAYEKHLAMGHMSVDDMYAYLHRNGNKFTKEILQSIEYVCRVCPVNNTDDKTRYPPLDPKIEPGERLHICTVGPYGEDDNKKYGLILVDYATTFMIGYIIDSIKDASSTIKEGIETFQVMLGRVSRSLSSVIIDENLHSDDLEFWALCKNLNVQFKDQPDRAVHELIPKITQLDKIADSPLDFWPFAFFHVIFLHNMFPKSDETKNPWSRLIKFNIEPPADLFTFGAKVECNCCRSGNKFIDARFDAVFLGYCRSLRVPVADQVTASSHEIVCYDIDSDKILCSTLAPMTRLNFPLEDLDYTPKFKKSASEINAYVINKYDKTEGEYVDEHIDDDMSIKRANNITFASHGNHSETVRCIVGDDTCKDITISSTDSEYTYTIPGTYKQAMQTPEANLWEKACQKVQERIDYSPYWHEVSLDTVSKDTKIFYAYWIYSVDEGKFNADIILKGRMQPMDYYLQSYGNGSLFTYIRIFLTLSILNNWEICHLDMKDSYNGVEIPPFYVVPPEGIKVKEGCLLTLTKCVRALRESGQFWYSLLYSILEDEGFSVSDRDPTYLYRNDCTLLLYVDDIIVFAKTKKVMRDLLKSLKSHMKFTNNGRPTSLFGMSLKYNDKSIEFSAEDIITKTVHGMGIDIDPKMPVELPLPENYDLASTSSPLLDYNHRKCYRSIVGMLGYISNAVRIDVTYYVSLLTVVAKHPRKVHFDAAIHLLKYLYLTRDKGLIFQNSASDPICVKNEFNNWPGAWSKNDSKGVSPESVYAIVGYYDSDLVDSKMHLGNLLTLGNNVVFWESVRKDETAKSSEECGIYSMIEITSGCVSILNTLKQTGIKAGIPHVCGSNPAFLYPSEAKSLSNKSSRWCSTIKDLSIDRKLKVWKTSKKRNPARCLSKTLSEKQFKDSCSRLMKHTNMH